MKIINTEKAPAAIGPYVQAIEVDGFVFTSGQIPVNPETKENQTDIVKATRQSLENIKAILEEAGTSLDNVIKTTVFVTDLDDFDTVNKVYGEYFSDHKPARSCIEVAALPAESIVEIEVIAKK